MPPHIQLAAWLRFGCKPGYEHPRDLYLQYKLRVPSEVDLHECEGNVPRQWHEATTKGRNIPGAVPLKSQWVHYIVAKGQLI